MYVCVRTNIFVNNIVCIQVCMYFCPYLMSFLSIRLSTLLVLGCMLIRRQQHKPNKSTNANSHGCVFVSICFNLDNIHPAK